MINKILILCCTILFAGCASKPPTMKVMEKLNSTTEKSDLSKLLTTGAINLLPSEKFSTSLKENGKVTNLIGTPSYYEVFESEYKANSSGRFELSSYCSCWGFDKRVMIPRVFVFDSKGHELEISNLEYKTIGASGITPLHLLLAGDFHSDENQTLKFVVLADNSNLDSVISNISLQNTYGRELMNLNVKSYPIGDYTFELSQQ